MGARIHLRSETAVHILVVGELDSEKEFQYFITLLNECVTLEVHITFIDANVLRVNVIETLGELQCRGNSMLYIIKRCLYSYLLKLGIKCQHIIGKTVREKTLSSNHFDVNEISKKSVLSFLKEINEAYGYDYTEYQLDSIVRRINISMIREQTRDFNLFRSRVLQNESLFEHLFLDFSINTTEFFRNPEVFVELSKKVIPYIDSYSHIKIWCAGCSTGKEPYSLAILLKEAGMLHKTQIYATDINPYIIQEAKNGLFPVGTLDKDISNYRKAEGKGNFIDYFEFKEQYIKINREFQKNILFFQHSLVNSGILNEFQLILCRNVLIYFNASLQKQVLTNFHRSLDISGFLLMGKGETALIKGTEDLFFRLSGYGEIYKKK